MRRKRREEKREEITIHMIEALRGGEGVHRKEEGESEGCVSKGLKVF